ncbi:hypothetical protein QC764_0021280 [Podospora pseudoanserina]|uniref:Uncharacterized protein n=1 Tax=Podospora pseudoanserina TaxID=2609844 RepID=A0ABR0IRZ7_9PEZI|nr:hypothetical protein QC764_0021280 [Podospora pseudoanserina]
MEQYNNIQGRKAARQSYERSSEGGKSQSKPIRRTQNFYQINGRPRPQKPIRRQPNKLSKKREPQPGSQSLNRVPFPYGYPAHRPWCKRPGATKHQPAGDRPVARQKAGALQPADSSTLRACTNAASCSR